MPDGVQGRVASVEKAMHILHAFSPHASQLSVRRLSERTGIPRSTAHAICVTLCDAGLLEAIRGGRYRLGPALVELGGQVIAQTGLAEAGAGVLETLARELGAEAHLGQLVGGWIVYVARVPMGRTIPMRNRVGLRAPAHLTGCGKAALAHLPPEQVRELVGATCAAEDRPVPDLARLADELAEAHGRGHVVNASFQAGRASVAAPVFDATLAAVGGLSAAGPTAIFLPEFMARAVEHVRDAADVVTARLGSGRGVHAAR